MREAIFQTALALLATSRLASPPESFHTTATATIDHVIRVNETTWDDDAWTLSSHVFTPGKYQSRLSLANGYAGISVAAAGPFFEIDHNTEDISGWPLFSTRHNFGTIAGFYAHVEKLNGTNYEWLNQYGGEDVISGLPHWSGLLVEAYGELLDARVPETHISNFTTMLNVEQGELSWKYVWTPGGVQEAIAVEYSMFVHKLEVNQAAVQLRLSTARDAHVTIYDVLDGRGAVRTDHVEKGFERDSPTIWTAVSPLGQPDVLAYLYSTIRAGVYPDFSTREHVTEGKVFGRVEAASIGQAVSFMLQADQTAEFGKYVGIASSDAFLDPKNTARDASIAGASSGYAKLLDSHVDEWRSILPRHRVDNYRLLNGSLPADKNVRELQITSVTNPFMILQNTVGPNAIAAAGNNSRLNIHSIPVCGLGSDCYGGLILWDAETWMALGLQVSHPSHIESVVNYRVDRYPQAKENIKMAHTSSKNQTDRFTDGAVFPWTSGRYGACSGTGPCFDYEYHVNGDIAIALRNQFIATGNAERFRQQHLPIANDIAYFYGEMVDYNHTSGFYEIRNATDPDEYANNVNNVGFTTALLQKVFDKTNEMNAFFNLPMNETWRNISRNMRLPVSEEVGIVLEYDTMNGSTVVKQADVVLIDDILHYKNPYSLTNLDYYANKQSPDGPGMTYATFSIVANEVSPSGCSGYTYALYSQSPYLRLPWFQYSEQMSDDATTNGGTHPAFPFLTGMGGSNRIGIYGYLGLRLSHSRLEIEPSLPPQIEYIDYRTFYWQGYGINASSNATHTTLRRMPNHILDTANPAYRDTPLPVILRQRRDTFSLGPTEPLTIPNRMIGQTPTAARNLLQCRPVLALSQSHRPPSTPPDRGEKEKGEEEEEEAIEPAHLPGQFPLAAIDGASSTKWQPYITSPSQAHYLSVDLGTANTPRRIQAVLLDWGAAPPAYYEVLFSNHSLVEEMKHRYGKGDGHGRQHAHKHTHQHGDENGNEERGGHVRRIASGTPNISEPYVPPNSSFAPIVRVKANQTNVTFARGAEEVWSGRFAYLGIQGRLGDDDDENGVSGEESVAGASVAEWSIIAWEEDGDYGDGGDGGGEEEVLYGDGDEETMELKRRVVGL